MATRTDRPRDRDDKITLDAYPSKHTAASLSSNTKSVGNPHHKRFFYAFTLEDFADFTGLCPRAVQNAINDGRFDPTDLRSIYEFFLTSQPSKSRKSKRIKKKFDFGGIKFSVNVDGSFADEAS